MSPPPVDHGSLPYRIAVLCYLFDATGERVLLLHRVKPPNAGMYSPIGGKLEVETGEGPSDCALREIREEAGLELEPDDIRMVGVVSEAAYEGKTHWLIFLFEVTRGVAPDDIASYEFDEGRLEWVPVASVATYPIPTTDRTIMWPLVRSHRGGFFVVHIDCSGPEMAWTVHESVTAAP